MMKRIFLFFAVALMLVVIQTGFFAPWFSGSAYPNLPLMALVAGVAVFGFNPVWRWAVLGGIIFDIFAYVPVGTHVILFSVAIYGVSFISRRLLVGERNLGIILFASFILPITLWERWGFYLLSGQPVFRFGNDFLKSLLVSAGANAALFFFSLWLIRFFILRFKGPEFKIVRT